MGRYSVKRIYTILLLMILLGISVVGCQQETTQSFTTIKSKTYNNTEYGFSLNYPSDWEVRESDGKGIYTVSFEKEPEAVVQVWVFHAPVYRSSISTLDIFCEDAVDIWENSYEEFGILEEHNTTVDGLPARSITIAFIYEDISWEQTHIFFLKEIPYRIIYTPMGSYDSYSDHFNLIVDTFKFSP